MLCEIRPSIKDSPERVISKGIIFVIISMHMYTCVCMYSYQPFPHTDSILHNCSTTYIFKVLYPEISLSSFSIHNNLFSFHYFSFIFMAACWYILKNVWDFTQPRALLLSPVCSTFGHYKKCHNQLLILYINYVLIQEYLQARLLATRFLMQRKVVGTLDKDY